MKHTRLTIGDIVHVTSKNLLQQLQEAGIEPIGTITRITDYDGSAEVFGVIQRLKNGYGYKKAYSVQFLSGGQGCYDRSELRLCTCKQPHMNRETCAVVEALATERKCRETALLTATEAREYVWLGNAGSALYRSLDSESDPLRAQLERVDWDAVVRELTRKM